MYRRLCASLEQYLELLHPLDPYFLWRNRDEICLYFQNNIGFMGGPGPQPLQKIGQRGGMTAKNDSSLRWVIRYPLFFGWLELVLRRLRRPECPAGPVLVKGGLVILIPLIFHVAEEMVEKTVAGHERRLEFLSKYKLEFSGVPYSQVWPSSITE